MSDPADPGPPSGKLAGIQRVLDRIALGEVPTAAELAAAPRLTDWMPVRDPHSGMAVLFGQVTGHPLVGDGRWVKTSALLALAPEGGWARTVSRFYVLGPARRKDQA